MRIAPPQTIKPRPDSAVGFVWDIDLLSGYKHEFLQNVAANPGLDHFTGVDTPEIGSRLRTGNSDAVLLIGDFANAFYKHFGTTSAHPGSCTRRLAPRHPARRVETSGRRNRPIRSSCDRSMAP